MAGEYEGDILFVSASADDCSVICRQGPLRFTFHGGKQVDERSGTVHRRFVGTIIAIVVVVHGKVTLERLVFVGLIKPDANQFVVYACVHRSVHETSVDWILAE